MGSDVSRISKRLKQHSCYFSDGWVPTLTTILKEALQKPNTHQQWEKGVQHSALSPFPLMRSSLHWGFAPALHAMLSCRIMEGDRAEPGAGLWLDRFPLLLPGNGRGSPQLQEDWWVSYLYKESSKSSQFAWQGTNTKSVYWLEGLKATGHSA